MSHEHVLLVPSPRSDHGFVRLVEGWNQFPVGPHRLPRGRVRRRCGGCNRRSSCKSDRFIARSSYDIARTEGIPADSVLGTGRRETRTVPSDHSPAGISPRGFGLLASRDQYPLHAFQTRFSRVDIDNRLVHRMGCDPPVRDVRPCLVPVRRTVASRTRLGVTHLGRCERRQKYRTRTGPGARDQPTQLHRHREHPSRAHS